MTEVSQIDTLTRLVAGIEIDVVIGGALQKIHFVAGTNPTHVLNLLREMDSSAQVRDSFPVRGGSAGRPTLAAKALVISAEFRADSTFIKITAHAEDGDDLSISVPRKKTADFIPSLEALGKLSEKNLAKLKAGIETKKPVTIILQEAEQCTVRYWVADDKSVYLDSVEA